MSCEARRARFRGRENETHRNFDPFYKKAASPRREERPIGPRQQKSQDLVATYLADEPMPRRAFRWRRPSVDALAFANAERCVHGFHARPSLRYVLARVARLVD